ncbi:MAG TPA: glycine oxidase ThiO [Gemmatimonadales bacterium]|jgi:glycine oxidase
MPQISDVLIVGGGAIGTGCARALALAGARVTVFEQAAPGEGWRASAGMLAAQVESEVDDPLFKLALAGRGFFHRNVASLRASTGIDIGLMECGILQLVRREADIERMLERVAWQRQQAHRADWLSALEVAEGWPWLGPSLGAFWAPEDGAVDPERLVAAMRADAVAHGAQFVTDTVMGLTHDDGQLRGVRTSRDVHGAGAVVIAAGAWSGRLADLPRPLSVEPVRGQMIAFPWPAAAAPAIVYGERCYLVKRGNEMLVGATVEHAGFDASVTPEAVADLHSRAMRVFPGLIGQEPVRRWAGLRPAAPDGLPIIGPEPRLPGLWYATAHGRNGILLAGITGELIARGMRGDPMPDDLHPFRPERFWDWS